MAYINGNEILFSAKVTPTGNSDALNQHIADENAHKELFDALEERVGASTQEAVDAWMNAHPEATTTVQDGSLTQEKFAAGELATITVKSLAELTSAISKGCKIIALGGNFEIDREVNFWNSTVLDGCGYTITRAAGFEGRLFVLNTGSAIRNIKIDGNREAMVNPYWSNTIEIYAGDHTLIEDVEIVNGNEAILLSRSDAIVRGCRITDCGGNGIHFSGSHRARVENCTIINSNLKSGMGHEGGCISWSQDCDNIVCENNWLEGGRAGFGYIHVASASNIKLLGNTVKGCGFAVDVAVTGADKVPQNIIINGNHFISDGGFFTSEGSELPRGFVYIKATENRLPDKINCIISSNIFEHCGIIINRCSDVVISDNTLEGENAYVRMTSAARISIIGNHIDSTKTDGYGIYEASSTDVIVHDNYIRAVSHAIYCTSSSISVIGNKIRGSHGSTDGGYFIRTFCKNFVFCQNEVVSYKDGITGIDYGTIENNLFYLSDDKKTAIYLTSSRVGNIVKNNRSNGQIALTAGENCVYTDNNIPLYNDKFYNLTAALANLSSTVPSKVYKGDRFSCTLTANEGYALPEAITVTNDGISCTHGRDYTYDAETGSITILCVMGAVVITANGV